MSTPFFWFRYISLPSIVFSSHPGPKYTPSLPLSRIIQCQIRFPHELAPPKIPAPPHCSMTQSIISALVVLPPLNPCAGGDSLLFPLSVSPSTRSPDPRLIPYTP